MTYQEALNLRNSLSDEDKFCAATNSQMVILIIPKIEEEAKGYLMEVNNALLYATLDYNYLDTISKVYSSNQEFLVKGVSFYLERLGAYKFFTNE